MDNVKFVMILYVVLVRLVTKIVSKPVTQTVKPVIQMELVNLVRMVNILLMMVNVCNVIILYVLPAKQPLHNVSLAVIVIVKLV